MTPASEHANSRATVADAMIHSPKTCGPATTVAHVREQFRDDHVHAVLVVDNGHLVAVVERPDINCAPPDMPARLTGRLHGRITTPDADLDATRRAMTTNQRRRLAVIDDGGTLLGLLCLKRTGTGFCSDADVQARADEGRNLATRTPRAARPDTSENYNPQARRAAGVPARSVRFQPPVDWIGFLVWPPQVWEAPRAR